MFDGNNFFDQTVRNNLITCENVQKLKQIQEMITQLVVCWIIIISKTVISTQQALDADPKAIQQIDFAENFEREGNTTMFPLLKKQKGTFQIFHKEL